MCGCITLLLAFYMPKSSSHVWQGLWKHRGSFYLQNLGSDFQKVWFGKWIHLRASQLTPKLRGWRGGLETFRLRQKKFRLILTLWSSIGQMISFVTWFRCNLGHPNPPIGRLTFPDFDPHYSVVSVMATPCPNFESVHFIWFVGHCVT